MTLRKLWFLFWSTSLIGAAVTILVGSLLLTTDHEIILNTLTFKSVGFNIYMMAVAGLMFGVFSQLGFFSYLTVNNLALSILRRSYLWNTLQSYIVLFSVGFLGYKLYNLRLDHENSWFFWIMPLVLLIIALAGAYWKMKLTNRNAFIPTVFLLFFVTMLEIWPSMNEGNNLVAIVFMTVPLYVCNLYQIMWLHRVNREIKAEEAQKEAKQTVSS